MALVSIQDLTFGFGGPLLFDGAELQIEPGERICLVGRNGEGKSTFLKLLNSEFPVESGQVARRQGLRVAMLGQTVPTELSGTIYEVVSEGLGPRGQLLMRHHELGESLAHNTDDRILAELERVQHELDASGAWEVQREVDRALSRLALDPEADVGTLSAGMKRRVYLARALVSEPDLLLLDEPTNHLDFDGIAWLEEFVQRFTGTLLFVTHDRAFLRRVATRIVELDRGRLRSWPGNYDTFVERRAAVWDAEAKEWERLDKKLAEEEAWIRKGIRARRTRNEGRVRALEQLREDRRERRERSGAIRASLQDAERSGRKVIDVQNLSFSFGDQPVVSNFTTKILRGDRIGLIGPNGVGKSTLLKLLLGELAPDAGTVQHGTRLEVAAFDQLHESLDEEKSLIDNVTDGQDFVEVGGQRRHIVGYLEDFLFSPDRIRGRASALSGGERNRLMLARFLARPANVLVLDEPTNDLDVESLEVLEEILAESTATVLIVSHDREFLDNVVVRSFVFEGAGQVREIVGGYQAWTEIRLREEKLAAPSKRDKTARKKSASHDPQRLSFEERKELEALPGLIEELEAVKDRWHTRMAEPDFYQQGREAIAAAQAELEETERRLTQAYERWEALETRS